MARVLVDERPADDREAVRVVAEDAGQVDDAAAAGPQLRDGLRGRVAPQRAVARHGAAKVRAPVAREGAGNAGQRVVLGDGVVAQDDDLPHGRRQRVERRTEAGDRGGVAVTAGPGHEVVRRGGRDEDGVDLLVVAEEALRGTDPVQAGVAGALVDVAPRHRERAAGAAYRQPSPALGAGEHLHGCAPGRRVAVAQQPDGGARGRLGHPERAHAVRRPLGVDRRARRVGLQLRLVRCRDDREAQRGVVTGPRRVTRGGTEARRRPGRRAGRAAGDDGRRRQDKDHHECEPTSAPVHAGESTSACRGRPAWRPRTHRLPPHRPVRRG
ncbi:MAG: hypothetical protein JWN65_3462 [Solirubrobacterales bacterium]|nr:hypothetical protein [Solirubrobacterales bacterium]